jgi:hypothetical protein
MSCAGPRAGWSLRGKKLSPKIYLEGTQTENDDEMAMGEIIIDQQGAGA